MALIESLGMFGDKQCSFGPRSAIRVFIEVKALRASKSLNTFTVAVLFTVLVRRSLSAKALDRALVRTYYVYVITRPDPTHFTQRA